MTTISRRCFLATAALSATAMRLHAQSPKEISATLSIPSETTGPQMPTNFVGLS